MLQRYRGAPLGKANGPAAEPIGKPMVHRIRIDASGYDAYGNYWGIGHPLYCVVDAVYLTNNATGYRRYIRAANKPTALATIMKKPMHPSTAKPSTSVPMPKPKPC